MNDSPATRRPGPRLSISIAALILGIVVAVSSIVVIVINVKDELLGPIYSVPSTVRLHLGTGTYFVYDSTGSTDSFDGRSGTVNLDASQVEVIAPNGEHLAVRTADHSKTITRNTSQFVAAVEFNPKQAGTYQLQFHTDARGSVMVQRPLGDLVRQNVVWVLGVVLGGLLGLAGAVMLIVGIVRRSRAKSRANNGFTPVYAPVVTPTVTPTVAPTDTPAGVSPPAWHPDPKGEHRLRYWDGTTWTDHTSD